MTALMHQDMRSLLFVPADAPRRLARAAQSGADALVVDLEDSVTLPHKEQARAAAAEFLRDLSARDGAPLVFVRINGLESGLADADLDAVMPARPHGIMLPKSRSGMDVQHLAAKLAVQEAENDLPDGSTRILPIVTESGAAIFGLSTYARASHRLTALAWGAEDLSADIGAEDNRDERGEWSPPFALVRHLTLFAAAAAGVPAIDTVFADFGDLDGLRHECSRARADGFAAKLAIHPDQVALINTLFTPSGEILARAEAIVAAFSARPDAGAVSIDGRMFDRPHLARAQRIIARAARAHQPPPD
ncbi:MAG: hpcH/HpaI aldolase/citrate lyase family protein [Hyphomicrobiales bacterium]|nr:hpcH/HpaI aldolase/citrate lyase family protein [Hyphomicrobiales bacterium]